jgi:hypothetical protein
MSKGVCASVPLRRSGLILLEHEKARRIETSKAWKKNSIYTPRQENTEYPEKEYDFFLPSGDTDGRKSSISDET